jgi:hypothetical protein
MGLGKSTAQHAHHSTEAGGHLRSDGRDIGIADPFLARWLR